MPVRQISRRGHRARDRISDSASVGDVHACGQASSEQKWPRAPIRQVCDRKREIKKARVSGRLDPKWLARSIEVTDCNAAFFDPAHGFAGCIPGIHEVLRRQGLMKGTWCLNPHETLSPGQTEEIDRVYRDYPHLHDDDFVRAHLQSWLAE